MKFILKAIVFFVVFFASVLTVVYAIDGVVSFSDNFETLIVMINFFVILGLHAGAAWWRQALGRSLFFCALLALIGIAVSPLTGDMMIGRMISFIVFCAMFGGAAFWALSWKPQSNPDALKELDAAHTSPNLLGFPDYYEKNMKEWMLKQEERRVKALNHKTWTFAVWLPLVNVILFLGEESMVSSGEEIPEGFGWVWIIANLIIVGVAIMPHQGLKDEIREKLLKLICGFFEDLKYTEKIKGMNKQLFEVCREMQITPYFSGLEEIKDGFSGARHGAHFEMVKVRFKTGSGRHSSTTFSGVLIAIQFPQPFKGRTKVLRDMGKVGNWFKNRQVSEERVNMTYRDFENIYEVYSTDQVEARALLTPDILQSFMTLGDLMAKENWVQAGFVNNTLLIAVNAKDYWNKFEVGNLVTDMSDTTDIRRFVEEVAVIYDIIDAMEIRRKSAVYEGRKAN